MEKWARSARFLIVDDTPEFRQYVRKILRHTGWTYIDQAEDGQQGLAMLTRHHYDLCLLDLSMPYLDGLGVLRAARDHAIDADFIVLTSSQDVEEAVEALQLGARDYLVKPFAASRLSQVAKQTLERRRRNTEVLADQIERFARTHSPAPADRADTILVVEDQAVVLGACRRLLTLAGYEVVAATTLAEAYSLLDSRRIDLVLLALRLPDGNGKELLAHLQKRDRRPEVIVTTAVEDVEVAMQLGRIGVRHYLPKPFEPQELLDEMRKALAAQAPPAAMRREDAVLSYIKAHCHRLNDRRPVAEHFAMHEKTVSRHVKSQTGASFRDFLHQCRIEKGKPLLLETGLPIKDIAQRIGFATPQHFTRIFQAQEGASPSTFRKQRGD